MSLIFAAIYRDGLILAEYTTFTGNFEQQGLAISKNCQGVKSSYQEGQYIYHTLRDQGFVYMCMTEVNYNRGEAHQFLEEIKQLVYQKCPDEKMKTSVSYGLNNKLKNDIKAKYDLYNSPDASKIRRAQHNINEAKDVLIQNLDKILKRAEILDVLVEKSNYQKVASSNMKKQASKIRQQQKCKKIKLYVLITLLVLVAIYIIMVIICGGFGLGGCFGSDDKKPDDKKKSLQQSGFLPKNTTPNIEPTYAEINQEEVKQANRCLAKVISDNINSYFS